MKAAVLQAFKQPLVWQEVDTPVPGPDEVLVQVMACGIDGTDLKLLDGFGYTPALPFVIGHEVAGVVAEVGEGVTGFEPGERVIVYNFTTCGDCLPCRTYRGTDLRQYGAACWAPKTGTAAMPNTCPYLRASWCAFRRESLGRTARSAATPA